MNVHEQFADDLALYALGSLAGDERTVLEKHLEGCGSCRRELEQLRGDMSLLAVTAYGPRPPARARQRLLTAIAAEPRKPARPRTSSRAWWGILGWVAATAMALVCVGLLRENGWLRKHNSFLNAQYLSQRNQLAQEKEKNALLSDPAIQPVILRAPNSAPQPQGKAYYRERSRSLIFLASSLPQLPPEKIYELWLFPASGGAPIPAGLFKPDARGNATVVNPPLPEGVEAKTFAVTLEPESGSHEAPRGTPVIVGAGE